jgi:hemolysin III
VTASAKAAASAGIGTERRPARPAWSSSPAERRVDLVVLAVGLLLGSVGAIALLATAFAASRAAPIVAAVAIYAATLPAMFGCALCYAAAFDTPRRGLLRRLDHAAIFAMIAGSATPFAIVGGGYALAAMLWLAAAAGIFVKLRYPIGRVHHSAAIYIALGWAAMVAVGPAIAAPPIRNLVLLGGAFYTIGIVFFLWRRLPYRRAIWHGFVVAGAASQYLAVLALVG